MKPAGQSATESFPKEPSRALEQMMAMYGNAVLRTAYLYTGDRHKAEDISQEVFIRAYRSWTAFRGNSTVKTWLTRITINLCRDKMRLKMSSEQPTDPGDFHGIPSESVEEAAMKRMGKTEILQHVLQLPAHYQEALYLYYYLELTTKEIAVATGTPEGTVRGRLYRARERLARDMKKEELAHE